MFTQCPQCDSVFQLSASQLGAANGDVRCGHCLSVFNALVHLSEDVPPAQETTASTGQTKTQIDNTNDVFNDIIAEVNTHNIPEEEIDRFEKFLATNTLPTEDSLPVDSTLFAENPTPDTITNTDFVDSLSADKTSASTKETNFGDIDTATAALDTDISIIADDEFAEFDAYRNEPGDTFSNTTPHINKRDPDDNKIIIEAADPEPVTSPVYVDTPDALVKHQIDADITNTVASKKQSSPANKTQTVNIPGIILDDLHAARARELRPSGTPWVIASLLLMFTLVLQVVYHSRDELVKDAHLRPWLIQMCAALNCTLSQPYDIKQIEIIGRDVRTHPSADNALIVSTTLINTATFAQPFPLLTMVFSDINGTKIAQRRFTPREYLSNTADLATGMIPDMPVRIDLELVDPGKAAVNYEFHAEIDPRQTRPLT